MAIKLSETQSSLMGAAAQRDDRLFSLPEGRSKAAARKAASELLAKGWAREVRAQGEAPIWRHDKDSQRAFALKLTAVGAKAIATVAGDGKTGSQPKPPREIEATPNTDERPAWSDDKARWDGKTISQDRPPASVVAPRAGTKIDKAVKMLSRPEGASLEALAKVAGWLPHTTSAALAGLRKRGYILERSRDEDAGPSIYRLTPPSDAEA